MLLNINLEGMKTTRLHHPEYPGRQIKYKSSLLLMLLFVSVPIFKESSYCVLDNLIKEQNAVILVQKVHKIVAYYHA